MTTVEINNRGLFSMGAMGTLALEIFGHSITVGKIAGAK